MNKKVKTFHYKNEDLNLNEYFEKLAKDLPVLISPEGLRVDHVQNLHEEFAENPKEGVKIYIACAIQAALHHRRNKTGWTVNYTDIATMIKAELNHQRDGDATEKAGQLLLIKMKPYIAEIEKLNEKLKHIKPNTRDYSRLETKLKRLVKSFYKL